MSLNLITSSCPSPLLSLLLITALFSLSVGLYLYWCINLCVVFLRFHVQVITYSVSAFLSDISLSIIPSKFIHFVANNRSTLFFCCCSVSQSCLTLCDYMDCSLWDLPVLHYLLDLPQTYVHWVDDAIQPTHPLLPPSPPALSLS